MLAIYSQAPSTAEAERLANSSINGLREYMRDLSRRDGSSGHQQVRLRQLGDAKGAAITAGSPLVIGCLTFIVAFVLTVACSLGLAHLARRRRGPDATQERQHEPVPLHTHEDWDDWPRTTRLLPWMLAVFIAMLWLVPFNAIELAASLPVDLKLDRLFLPLIIVAWLFVYAARRTALRLSMTPIHLALAAFLACALLSVVLEAGDLNQALELEEAVKRLLLLVAYVPFFAIVASSVRSTEVRPFLNYTLVLAVVCGVGIIWEYRMDQNLFSIWSDRLLPGAFTFAADATGETGLDSLGRRGIAGPARQAWRP